MSALRTSALCTMLSLTACGGGGGGGGGNNTPPPPPATYSVTASVSGLSGSGLGLTLTGGATTAVTANGTVSLVSGLATGTSYAVKIDTQPVNPVQTCAATGASGTVSNSNVTISVVCVAGTASTVNAAQVTVTVDKAIPPATASAIANVVSPLDTQKPGKTLYMPLSGSGGESAIIAADASGNIMLASLSTTSPVNLTADSTALFLVRMALGAMPDTGMAFQVNVAIRATAEYPNLVSLITAHLAANTPASTATDVYLSINTVYSELPTAVLQTLAAMGAPRARAAVQQGSPVATPNLTGPRNIFTTSAAGHPIGAVAITGTTQNGSLTATNTTAIAWSIASADTSGSPICPLGATATSGNPDCSVTIERTSLAQQFTSTTVSTGTVPGNGDAFNITLEQNLVSRTQNVVQTVEDTASVVLAVATAGESLPYQDCLNTAIEKFLKPADIANLVADPTGDGFNAYFNSVFTISSVGAIAGTCAKVALPVSPGTADTTGPIAFGKAVAGFISGFSNYVKNEFAAGIVGALQVGTNAFGIPLEIAQTYWAWSKSLSIGVCEAGSPPGIVNCAVSLTFTPASATLLAGTTFAPVITAYDSSGALTLLPPDLQFSSSDTTVATVDPNLGTATALTLPSGSTWASATVTGTDANTGLTGSYTLAITAEAPGTCNPPADATTCAMTIYSIPDNTHTGFTAPVAGTVTTVQTSNGTTTTTVDNLSPLGVSIYNNVNGPPLTNPICNYEPAVGCPPLTTHVFNVCAVDGKYTPVSYHSVVSFQVPLLSNSGCTGAPAVTNVITGYNLSADGILTGTTSSTESENYTCTGVSFGLPYVTTHTLTSTKNDPIAMNLVDGSGNASVSENLQENDTDSSNANGNLAETTVITGTQTWPAEAVSPPTLPNTGIIVTHTPVPAGEALPKECTVGVP
jgi:hypothetical protein